MAAEARLFSLDEVTVQLGDFLMNEFSADGVEIAADEDRLVATQGSHGSVSVSKKFDNVSELTLSIMGSSPNNSIVNSLLDATFRVLVRDLNGDDLVTSPQARFLRRPDMAFAEEQGSRELVIKLFNDDRTYGGNVLA